MSYASVHDMRDLLSLAKVLRRFAEEHANDNYHDRFISTAMELEARAHSVAAGHAPGLGRELALYAPVNRLV